MRRLVRPSTINGTLYAPASKSMMQRAIAAALLSEKEIKILNPTYSNDAKAALRVIEAMGANIISDKEKILIRGGLNPTGEILNCGESGLSIRMFSPIAALCDRQLTLTGEGSLLSRPVSMITEPLTALGVKVSTSNGCPPIQIQGPIKGGETRVDGSVSSQVLTGLLIALPVLSRDTEITVEKLKSKPYIDMTIDLLKSFGIEIRHIGYKNFYIKGNQKYDTGEYRVEGDWSGASFLLVAGAIGGYVKVKGLNPQSPQADRRIIEALRATGVGVKISHEAVEITAGPLNAFEFDATDSPDLFPPLTALACNCSGTTRIKGVERLTYKESNRAEALGKVFFTLGAEITIKRNVMEIKGKKLKGGIIDSFNDHRIAMAGAIAAINAEEEVIVKGSQCVAKSYPDFFENFRLIGGMVDE